VKHSNGEAEPAVAAELCGSGLDNVRTFTLSLATEGEKLGLIGPDEAERIWTRHVLNCALIAPEIPAGSRVADVGSGAGLPGLVLAMIRPDCEFVLIEPLERRTRWLTEQVSSLALANVSVFNGRAEEYPEKGTFDVVTARAVKSLKGLIPWVEPLAKNSGQLVLMKGQRVDEEIVDAATVIARHRLIDVSSRVLGEGKVSEPTRVFAATVER
jgi:16S rRNA (guanine527-N7)-methyltransferase